MAYRKSTHTRERCACVRTYIRTFARQRVCEYVYDKQFNKLTKKSSSSNGITDGHEFRTDPFRSWNCMFWFRLSAQKQEKRERRNRNGQSQSNCFSLSHYGNTANIEHSMCVFVNFLSFFLLCLLAYLFAHTHSFTHSLIFNEFSVCILLCVNDGQ